METPILDKLEKRVHTSYLRKWITRELGEEPMEFSTLTPEQSKITDKLLKIRKYSVNHSTEGKKYYYVLKGEGVHGEIRMVVNYDEDDKGQAIDATFWVRPSDLPKILDEKELLELLLKEF